MALSTSDALFGGKRVRTFKINFNGTNSFARSAKSTRLRRLSLKGSDTRNKRQERADRAKISTPNPLVKHRNEQNPSQGDPHECVLIR